MRKEAVFALVLLVFTPFVYSLNPGTVMGYVFNTSKVIEPGSNVNITVVGCSGSGCFQTAVTDSNGFYIKSNFNLVPGNTVTVSAKKGLATGINSSIATGTGSVGVAEVNVTICLPPTEPALTHVSDTHSTTVSMNWTTFRTGSEFDEFVLDSNPKVSPAFSPQVASGLTFATHTWKVRTCNLFCCSSYRTDTFHVINNPPQRPNLTVQGHTQLTTISFSWTNFTDPNGDSTHNEFQLATDEQFTSIIASNLSAASPQTVSGLSTFTLFFWRVRTCDIFGACSGYSNGSFFVYQCPSCLAGGGGGTRKVFVNQTCTPSWECGSWGSCNNGVITRSCTDINNCVTNVPSPFALCTYQAPPTQPTSPINNQYYIGDLSSGNTFQEVLTVGQKWSFMFKGTTHFVTLMKIDDTHAELLIESTPNIYDIPRGGSINVDIDGDGIPDITITSVVDKDGIVSFVFTPIIHPEVQSPLNTQLLLQNIQGEISRTGFVIPFLLVLILLLLSIILYQYERFVKREVKIDKRLSGYIVDALETGFTESQIRNKLLDSGFAEIEVDYILKNLEKGKSKNNNKIR